MNHSMTLRSITLILLLLGVYSCGEGVPKTESEEKTSKSSERTDEKAQISGESVVDDTVRLSENLPEGRFQLPTTHTPADDLWITLPEGYQIHPTSQMPNDEFIIFQSDDPSQFSKDSAAHGVMRLAVTVNAEYALTQDEGVIYQKGYAGDEPVSWRRYIELLPDGAPYYQAECLEDEFFSKGQKDGDLSLLNLHVYVGGSDSTVVEELIASLATLSTKP